MLDIWRPAPATLLPLLFLNTQCSRSTFHKMVIILPKLVRPGRKLDTTKEGDSFQMIPALFDSVLVCWKYNWVLSSA